MLTDDPQGHFFDEGNVQLAVDGKAHQVIDFAVVAALEHHAVEFGAAKAGCACGVDAGDDLVQIAGAGKRLEALRVEAVEADVQARQPGIEQGFGQTSEL
ncbi:hypothetical protein D3C85_1619550 [compost metagenome]